MSCCCHIRPPCAWCLESYECASCGAIKHPEDDGENLSGDDIYCDACAEDLANEAKEQEADFLDRLDKEPNE